MAAIRQCNVVPTRGMFGAMRTPVTEPCPAGEAPGREYPFGDATSPARQAREVSIDEDRGFSQHRRLALLYAANRTRIEGERDRLVAARDRLERVLERLGTGAEGIVDAEVRGLVSGCFRIWHGIGEVFADLPFHHGGSGDPLDVSGALASCDIDRIEDGPLLMREWGIDELRAVLSLLERDAAMLEGWSMSARQVVLFEMLGQGRVAEVNGHLPDAKHLAVYVPGMGTDLWDFDRLVRTRTEVIRSRALAIAEGGEVTTITWLGYDPPRDLDVVGGAQEELARVGSAALSRFLHVMVDFAPPGVHVTVLAHSYGSVLAGLAARDYGLAAHELVVLGSPGLGVESADQLMLMPGGRVWAAQAHDDPVTWVPRLEDHPLHLHGPSPTAARFGAHVFPVAGRGHTSYFEDEQSLSTLAGIVVDRFPDAITSDRPTYLKSVRDSGFGS